MGRAVTIKDIAKRVGQSNVTVSYALRGSTEVSEATRLRVKEVAREMGYRANGFARSMQSGRFGNIGLLCSSESARSNLPTELLNGIESELAGAKYHLTVGRLPDEKLASQGVVPGLLAEWTADGLLINYQESIPSRMIELIETDHVPAVWINSKQRDACVYAADLDAGRSATEQLLRMGHRRIAYVDYSHGQLDLAEPGVHYSAADRAAGYEQAMIGAGLPPQLIRPERKVAPELRPQLASDWLAAQVPQARPTAVLGYSGSTTAPLYIAALRLGLRIPEDLSIVSFDDAAIYILGPRLTTWVVPQHEMGRSAARMLLDRVAAKVSPTETRLAVAFDFDPGQTVSPPTNL